MKKILLYCLTFLLCIMVSPSYAFTDGGNLSREEYLKVVPMESGLFYPLIKDDFYDSQGYLKSTFDGEYYDSEMSEDLPGKTPVEFISAFDGENNREFLGYCYRADGTMFYDVYARIGAKAKRIVHYESDSFINAFRSGIDCEISRDGKYNYIVFHEGSQGPADEFGDGGSESSAYYRIEGNWNLEKVNGARGEVISTGEMMGYDDEDDMSNQWNLFQAYNIMQSSPEGGYDHFFGDGEKQSVDDLKLALAPLLSSEVKDGKVDQRYIPSLTSVGLAYGQELLDPDYKKEDNTIEGWDEAFGPISEACEELAEYPKKSSYSVDLEAFADFYKKYYDFTLSPGDYEGLDVYNKSVPFSIGENAVVLNRSTAELFDRPRVIRISNVNSYYDHAIITVDYVSYKGIMNSDGAAGIYIRRNVLVKKVRDEDEIKFVPLYVSKKPFDMEGAQKIMGYDFKPIYTSSINFRDLSTLDPSQWTASLKEALESAGYEGGTLVDVDGMRIKRFVYDYTSAPRRQVIKKRTFAIDGSAIAHMENDAVVPQDFVDYAHSLGVDLIESRDKSVLYIDVSKARGRGVEFYIKNLDYDTFPDYLVIKKGKDFTWILPKAGLYNNAYYFIDCHKDQLQIEVAMGDQKSEFVPLSFLILGDKIETICHRAGDYEAIYGLEGEKVFVPVETGIYTLSTEKRAGAEDGYEIMMERMLSNLAIGENGINRLALGRILSFTPIAPEILQPEDVSDAPKAPRDMAAMERLLRGGIYEADNGAVHPESAVGIADTERIIKPLSFGYDEEEVRSAFKPFTDGGGREGFISGFKPIASSLAAGAADKAEEGTQTEFVNSLDADEDAIKNYHGILGLAGFSLLKDIFSFPTVLWLILIFAALIYCVLAYFGQLPERYNLFLPKTHRIAKENLMNPMREDEGMERERGRFVEEVQTTRLETGGERIDKEKYKFSPTSRESEGGAPVTEPEEEDGIDRSEEEETEKTLIIPQRKPEKKQRFCGRCGTERKGSSRFCGKCGFKFTD